MVGYGWIVLAAVGTGFLSFGLWVHHMFTTGLPGISLGFFSAASEAVAIPTGVQFFCFLATLLVGNVTRSVPMLFVFAGLATFVLGGLTGVMVALAPFDFQAKPRSKSRGGPGAADRRRRHGLPVPGTGREGVAKKRTLRRWPGLPAERCQALRPRLRAPGAGRERSDPSRPPPGLGELSPPATRRRTARVERRRRPSSRRDWKVRR
jgi:hypothetical protein